jgi:hypothetical protein
LVGPFNSCSPYVKIQAKIAPTTENRPLSTQFKPLSRKNIPPPEPGNLADGVLEVFLLFYKVLEFNGLAFSYHRPKLSDAFSLNLGCSHEMSKTGTPHGPPDVRRTDAG